MKALTRLMCRSVVLRLTVLVAALSIGFAANLAQAQSTPDSNEPHNPAAPTINPGMGPPAMVQPPMPGMGSSGGGMMGGMMGRPPPKQFYPTLMELPASTPEIRSRVAAEALARINAGNAILTQAQSEFRAALIAGDPAAMWRATVRQRDGLVQIESGSAALQALADGKPPRQIALVWFRDQLSLTPALIEPVSADASVGPFGLTWFHLVSMVAVALFATTLVAFNFAQRRRSQALVSRLTGGAPAAGPGSAPASQKPADKAPPSGTPLDQSKPPGSPKADVSPPPAAGAKTQLPPLTAKSKTWSGKLRVAAIYRETPHVKTFRLVEPAGELIPFTFSPGQFLTFSTKIDDKMVRRSYSIASPPTRVSYVEITVKREEDGLYSDYLHDTVGVGDLLAVTGPAGVFKFDGEGAKSVVLIAGGVGITPLMCITRYLTDLTWPGEIFLLSAARSIEELIFEEELEYLQKRCPNLHVTATVETRAEGSKWAGLDGKLTKSVLAEAVPGIAERRIHLCGPPRMIDALRAILAELDVPKDHIKTEAFGPAVGAVPAPNTPDVPKGPPPPVVAALKDVDQEAPATPSADGAAPGPASAVVKFAKSNKDAPLPPDKSVLETAESIDVPIDYQCRVGTCGICKIRLLEGKVTMEVEDALTPEDKTAGIILACQAKSLANISVDA